MNMTREYYCNYIIDKMQWLCDYIESQKKAGLYDVLVYCEDMFCSILSIIYDLDLKKANSLNLNMGFPDLVDVEKAIAIEITSDISARKIKSIFERFGKGNYKHYNTLMIFLLTLNKPHYKTDVLMNKLSDFVLKTDIRDVSDLIQRVHELSLSDLQKVFNCLKNIYNKQK